MTAWAPPPLAADVIHVWAFALDLEADRLSALRQTLSPEEGARAGRFRFARHRDRFVAARGQLREVLARYLDVPPGALAFAYGPQGKPFLAGTEGLLHAIFAIAETKACDEINGAHSYEAYMAAITFGSARTAPAVRASGLPGRAAHDGAGAAADAEARKHWRARRWCRARFQ